MRGGGLPSCLAAPLSGPEIDALLAPWTAFRHIAIAVSGGADSMALMILARGWRERAENPPALTILTVDHGLRAEAEEEAAWVKEQAERLGLAHQTLIWSGPKPASDLQAAARAARYGLMLDFCKARRIEALATAHTAEDQAETTLMRLARGSGIDGLAAISPVSVRNGIALLRPLLDLQRARLEATLLEACEIWIEDPSNCDRRFERVRLREALRAAKGLQLVPEKLALSARRLERARLALDRVTGDFLKKNLHIFPAGSGELALGVLLAAPEEIAIRTISRLAEAFGGGQRPLRLARIEDLHRVLTGGARAATLGGCVFAVRGPALRVAREFGRIDAAPVPLPEHDALVWDGRFSVSAPGEHGVHVCALGAAGVADIREAGGRIGLPARIAHSLPGFWRGKELVFAPFAAFPEGSPAAWLKEAGAVFVGGERLGLSYPDRQGENYAD
jgi:tRNA(Ile)-lysidine synthase